MRWQPVSPQAAAAHLLSDRDAALRAQEEVLRIQRRQIQEQHDWLVALIPVYLQARQHAFPQGTIDHLPDKSAVRTLLTDVIDPCRSEVVSKDGGAFPPAALREALPRDLAFSSAASACAASISTPPASTSPPAPTPNTSSPQAPRSAPCPRYCLS